MIIDLHVPTSVVFGRGRLAELGDRVHAIGSSALVLCGRSAMRRSGVLTTVVTLIEQTGVGITVFDGVSPDPKAVEVDRAAELARTAGADVIIGLGGGSAIDAAKATAIGLRDGPVGPLVGTSLPARGDTVPVVAVPTTAGSGAEVTKGAIITDTARGIKAGIRGGDLFPILAIIDPDLLTTVPIDVAVATGFDALTHAVEACLARKASPLNRAFANEALGILGRRLPQVAAGRTDAGLRDDLALAALLGGLNVVTASTCLPHRLQQAMGAVPRVRISHGRGLAAVYPAWLRHVVPYAEPQLAVISNLLGVDGPDTGLCHLIDTIGVGAPLDAYGFRPEDIDTLADCVVGNTENDPIPTIDRDLIRTIYAESFASASATTAKAAGVAHRDRKDQDQCHP